MGHELGDRHADPLLLLHHDLGRREAEEAEAVLPEIARDGRDERRREGELPVADERADADRRDGLGRTGDARRRGGVGMEAIVVPSFTTRLVVVMRYLAFQAAKAVSIGGPATTAAAGVAATVAARQPAAKTNLEAVRS